MLTEVAGFREHLILSIDDRWQQHARQARERRKAGETAKNNRDEQLGSAEMQRRNRARDNADNEDNRDERNRQPR